MDIINRIRDNIQKARAEGKNPEYIFLKHSTLDELNACFRGQYISAGGLPFRNGKIVPGMTLYGLKIIPLEGKYAGGILRKNL